jgi:hypothetical protein
LKAWCKRNKVPLELPYAQTEVARYNRVRQRAHQLGLRLSMQSARVSLWVAIEEDLSLEEAERLLRNANRKERLDKAETAFGRGLDRLHGETNGAACCAVPFPWTAHRALQMGYSSRRSAR